MRKPSEQKGFTMIEVLIAIAVGGILAAAVSGFFVNQARNMTTQNQVVDMQQKLRVGIGMFERELRMAGFNNPDDPAGATIVSAGSDFIYFTQDLNGDGALDDVNEHISFCTYNSTLGLTQGDDNSVGGIHAHNHQPIFLDLEGLQLYYTLANGTLSTAPGSPEDIRSVQIALLARSQSQIPGYSDTKIYPKPDGGSWGPYNDAYRRQLITSTVLCRNMGL